MKTLFVLLIISLGFYSCKKCDGKYTIEGVVWNGTKNKPWPNVKLISGAGGGSTITGKAKLKDFADVTTDANGKFKITYDCVEDGWQIYIRSYDLPYPAVASSLPSNQNLSNQKYNIPDSVTLHVNLVNQKGLGVNDTLYVVLGSLDNLNYYTNSTVHEGTIIEYRTDYASSRLGKSIAIAYGIGYEQLMNNASKPWYGIENLSKPEPEINVYNIYY